MEKSIFHGAKGTSPRVWKQNTMLYPRKRLSDITNISFNSFEEELQSDGQEDGHVGSPVMANEYIAKLLKENNVLMRALAERNTEVQKLRMIVTKTSQQNLQLAQAHSHMQAELNLSKDRLKIAQHELVCTSTTLGLKTQELKEHKMLKKNKVVQNISSQEGHIKPIESVAEAWHIKPIESVAEASQLSPHKKTCLSNRKRPQRSQSLGPKILTNQGVVKEKDDNPRKPLRRKSINPKVELCVPTDDLFVIEKDDNPRKPLRRKSINPKVELCIPTDDLFEIENAKLPKRESKDESSAIQPDHAEASQLSPHKKTCLSNRKCPQRSQSLGPKILTNQGVVKEKDDNPRKPLRRKSINPKVELCIPSEDFFEIEKDDNPRKPLRRKSINPKVELCIPTDDLFEIENAKFPICSVYKRESKDESSAIQPDHAVPVTSNMNPVNEEVGKENQKFNQLQYEGMRRASLGRPLRKAAERVNSYKELPLKAKLRRSANFFPSAMCAAMSFS